MMKCMLTPSLKKHNTYFLNISFNIAKHVICIQVVCQIWNETKTVTDIYQRTCIRKLCFHQEVLRFLRVIEIRFSCYTFNFFNLSSPGGRLNILEMYIWIFTVSGKKNIRKKKVLESTPKGTALLKFLSSQEVPGTQI